MKKFLEILGVSLFCIGFIVAFLSAAGAGEGIPFWKTAIIFILGIASLLAGNKLVGKAEEDKRLEGLHQALRKGQDIKDYLRD